MSISTGFSPERQKLGCPRPPTLLDSVGQPPVGLGTFDVVYPAYRSFYTTLYVNAAHNDYLQVLIETGIVGFGCVVWFGSVL